MSGEDSSDDVSLPASVREHIDAICRDFEAAWQAGLHPRIENYLEAAAESERTELLRQLLLLDMDYRGQLVPEPTQGEYETRFPDDGSVVADVFNRLSNRSDHLPTPGHKIRYFGDYELLEKLGSGGMGVVYKARQTSLNRIVAIKMIRTAEFASEDEIRRFHGEAEAVARLDHPNIVSLYEVGQHQGQHYFSMAYVDGQSLADQLRKRLPATRTAAEYLKTAAEAMYYAHQRGVVHRDIKPGNVLIDRSGRIRITDFGLAKRMDSDSQLTRDFQVLGTPEYMAPEQAQGQIDRLGPAADIYSLGALLYALLTGRPPFHAASPVATLRQVVDADPIPPRQLNPEVSRDLETITLKCLEKDPAHRFADAQELVDELQRFLDGTPVVSRPISEREWIERWARKKGYDIQDELRRSDTSVEFRARQSSLNRTVVLEVFQPPEKRLKHCEKTEDPVFRGHGFVMEFPAGSSLTLESKPNTEREQRRFIESTKIISQFQHENIVTVYDFGRFGERPFVVTELIDGGSLDSKVAHSQTEIVQVVEKVVSVARAIDFANRKGVIHGNLSPASILLSRDGTLKVTGFGLIQFEGELCVSAFMSPEATGPFGGPLSSRTDVYGLGAILYYLLTGRPPLEGTTLWETIRLVIRAEPVAPRQINPSIEPDLEAICLKCLEKDPDRRYATASEFAADLGRYLRGETTLARKANISNRVYHWCKRRLTRPF